MNGTVQKERRPTGSQQCLWRLQIRYRKTAREQRTDLTATVLEASKSTLMYSYYVLSEGKQGQTKRRGLNQLKRTILIKVFLIKSRQISQKTQGDLYDGVTLFFHKSKNICEEKHKALTLQTTAEREEKPRTTNLGAEKMILHRACVSCTNEYCWATAELLLDVPAVTSSFFYCKFNLTTFAL